MAAGVMSNLTVLVVDDKEPIRELICGILDTFGVGKVREASDGLGAFRDMKAHMPDAVITDLTMQPVDGLTFTRTVRTDPASPAPDVPILMITLLSGLEVTVFSVSLRIPSPEPLTSFNW